MKVFLSVVLSPTPATDIHVSTATVSEKKMRFYSKIISEFKV